jgi:RNA polymerase sigma factor (sigma-70 family)
VRVLVAERERFHRFLTARLGNATEADDLLQDSLLRALEKGSTLRRGELVIAWFYRILRHAIADYYRAQQKNRGQLDRLWTDLRAAEQDRVPAPADWDTVMCACFEGLLPTLKPRYAEVLRRIDLRGEAKSDAARSLNITVPTLDVVLHRARTQLRERLEVFCGACSKESCLTCACQARERRRVEKV